MIKVHTRKQVMYSLDIGSEHPDFCSSHPAIELLSQEVSKVVGGCTLIDCIGLWADVERADRLKYDDVEVGVESNVQLQVKAEVPKEQDVELSIVETLVLISQKWPELGINWVCGHKVTKEGLTVSFNFSTDENKLRGTD